ncbi:MAG: phenylacetate--CoA ligase family protein [Methylocella sp.]
MTMTFDIVSSDSDNELLKEIQDSDSQHASHDTVLNETANQDYALLEFWESEHTRPAYSAVSGEMTTNLGDSFDNYIGRCMEHPFLPQTEIKRRQFERIKYLVELAYAEIPVYRDKYKAAGFHPSDLRGADDIDRIPIITKSELVAAFPGRCINPRYRMEDLFPTRSSGSSGQTLLIRVDPDAIVTDTIQGVRQFALQSGLKYGPKDLLMHVYTVPWWFPSIGNDYRGAFISNVIPPDRVAKHLAYLSPHILSCYPSNLEALLPYAEQFNASLYLAVTHSEYSAKSARQEWSQQLGVPVLDEYSSEEATRIAIELPCGHYHVCEDSVRLDVVDPVTLAPQVPGQSGLSVITNLLNEAMPFIRYMQGDYVTEPAHPHRCGISWKQLESIDGRANDAFVNAYGRVVPAGSVLDITYRWMFDCNINLQQFEIIQKAHDLIEARFIPGAGISEERILGSIGHLVELLSLCLEHKVKVHARVMAAFPPKTGKRRPIRREMAN